MDLDYLIGKRVRWMTKAGFYIFGKIVRFENDKVVVKARGNSVNEIVLPITAIVIDDPKAN
jgi:ribosomal protein L35AE/L33A